MFLEQTTIIITFSGRLSGHSCIPQLFQRTAFIGCLPFFRFIIANGREIGCPVDHLTLQILPLLPSLTLARVALHYTQRLLQTHFLNLFSV